MSTLRERLIEARKEKGLSQIALANLAKCGQSTIACIENGRNQGSKILPKLARILDVNIFWLTEGRGSKRDESSAALNSANSSIESPKNYPRVVGTARMGDNGYYLDLEGGNGYLEFESEKGSIAINVRGDSMHPAIRDNWYVVIEPSGKPTAGEYVLLNFLDGKHMVKELLMEKLDCYIVMSVNSGDRITVMKDQLHDIRAISAVIPPSKHKDL